MPTCQRHSTLQYVLEDGGNYVRAVNVRDPYVNEPDGTRYCVTGDGHEYSEHASLAEAQAAAKASLPELTA